MNCSDNAAVKFYLLNDISKKPTLKMNEFLKLEKSFYNKDLSHLLKAPLWEIAEKAEKISLAERIYIALKDDKSKLSLKKLGDDGISVVASGDSFYPKRLVEKLGNDAPPILYTIGDISLFNQPSAGVTGSRKPSEEGKKFAEDIGEIIAHENKVLVSGGALGCDTIATDSTIKNGGRALWFTAVPLSQILRNRQIISWIESRQICLCTDVNPYGEFNANQALKRNTYIYANCETAFVCECKSKISGTFSGAKKSLLKKLCELYVYSQNTEADKWLIENGAVEITD